MKRYMNNEGSAGLDILLYAFIFLVFIVFPVYSMVMEKAVINIKSSEIIDAIDLANTSIYKDLNVMDTSVTVIDFSTEIGNTYKKILAENLKLNPDMSPTENSVAEGIVVVNSVIVYPGGFPLTCPNGRTIGRPAVHSTVTVPVKPSLYRELILNMVGLPHFELVIHRDTELPVNN